MKEVTISSENDEFYNKIMFSNFGDVADAIHNLVQSFLKNKKSVAQFNTIEDMQRIIENFPELKKKFLGVFSIGKNKIILLEKIIS